MTHLGELFATRSWWMAGLVTLLFTALARWLRGVNWSGAHGGAGICFITYASAGPGAVLLLAIVFALTWGSTRFGYPRKHRLGIAESNRGRNAWQVLANLGVTAACALASALTGRSLFLVGLTASLAEAAADTVSSELGQAYSNNARLITNWRSVEAGTSGGVTGIGTAAGLVAAITVGVASAWLGLVPLKTAGISVLAAILGMTADSFLGATLENQGSLNNNWVNFAGTSFAAMVALLLAQAIR